MHKVPRTDIMTGKEKKLKQFDVVLSCRNAEIELFWKRSSYYWVFVAAALVAYGVMGKSNHTLGLLISCFGLMSSLAWMLGNIGSKWWQENWEQKLNAISPEIVGDVFTPIKDKDMPRGSWSSPLIRYSVTRLATTLSAFVVIFWLALFVKEIYSMGPFITNQCLQGLLDWIYLKKDVVICATTIFFVILMCWRTRGKDR